MLPYGKLTACQEICQFEKRIKKEEMEGTHIVSLQNKKCAIPSFQNQFSHFYFGPSFLSICQSFRNVLPRLSQHEGEQKQRSSYCDPSSC